MVRIGLLVFQIMRLPLVGLLLSHCTSNSIDIEAPSLPPTLVVNGWLSPTACYISLTHGTAISDTFWYNGRLQVTEAEVSLYDNSDRLIAEIPEIENGIYYHAGTIDTLRQYYIQCKAKNYPTARTKTLSLPRRINNLSLVTGDTTYITFKDLPEEQTYITRPIAHVREAIKPLGAIDLLDVLFQSQCGMFVGAGFHFWPDVCFEEQSFTIPYEIIRPSTPYDSISLVIGTVSKDFYRYAERLDQPGTDIDATFSQPHLHYTNIENGYGVVGAWQLDTFRVE